MSCSFEYDALAKRTKRTDSSGATRYVYDGDNLIAETDSAGNIVAWYTPGVCMSRKVGQNWETYYYHTDQLGNTRQVTDRLQRVTEAYAYNAWGEEHGRLRPDFTNPLRFVGKSRYYSDDDTGLVLLGVRYYDPLIGRFITPDPSRDGPNWYAYVGDNPVGNIDPAGMERVPLSATQSSFVERAITYIDHTPIYSSYAAPIKHMFKSGHVGYDPDETGGLASWGFAGIAGYIDIGLLHNDFSLQYGTQFRGTVRLAASLVHEQAHINQGMWDVALGLPQCDLEAYNEELGFLGQLQLKIGLSGRRTDFWGTPEQKKQRLAAVQEMWDDCHREAVEAMQKWHMEDRVHSMPIRLKPDW